MKNTSVFGMYRDRVDADEAIQTLRAAGFRNADTSVLFQENEGTKDLGHQKSTKAPELAVGFGIVGAIVGGVLGWLAGMGNLSIPGLDRLAAAGPYVAALAGVGALGALTAIIGALLGLATPEYEARRFRGRLKRGNVLLSVHCDEEFWVKRAKETLRLTGAEGIGTAAEANADFSISDKPRARAHRTSTSEALPTNDPLLKTREINRETAETYRPS